MKGVALRIGRPGWVGILGAGATLALVLVACTATTDATEGQTPGIEPGGACTSNESCASGICTNGACAEPTHTDGVKNGDETDVDCGGSAPQKCASGKACTQPSDCTTSVCVDGKCGTPGNGDGVKNNSETDVDCGGPGVDVPRCAPGKHCEEGPDCASKICNAGTCATPSPTDGVANGDETDVDCGGAAAPKCAAGKGCKLGTDCTTGACKAGKCVSPSATDGEKNGTETDIDCGGDDPGTPRCGTNKTCIEGPDCESLVCDPTSKKCKAPSPTDGVKNGKETDIDCGGGEAGTPKCGAGKSCAVHGDCSTNGCNFESKCATAASCTKLEGGYTCGQNDSDLKQNDCCESATVGPYKIDKYQITAGRMRAFLDRFNGDVRTYAQGLPANVWNPAYNIELPTNYNEANDQLGPLYDKRACQTGDHTGHVFWTPPTADDKEDFPKNVRDTKALNCVPWWLMNVFCIWDGGHLATEAEIKAAYTNNNTTSYPWGAIGTYKTTTQNDYAIQLFGYATPNPPATAHSDGTGFYDIAFYVAPPGRRPLGYSQAGVADMVGNLLEWVSDRDRQFIWKGSWENHASEADNFTPGVPNDPYSARSNTNAPWQWGYNIGTGRPGDGRGVGYYGIGGRCAR